MLKPEFTGKFKKDFRLAVKRGCNINKLDAVIQILRREEPLPPKYHDHALEDTITYKKVRECHIEPDWLLIYKVDKEVLVLRLLRTGSHSDLF